MVHYCRCEVKVFSLQEISRTLNLNISVNTSRDQVYLLLDLSQMIGEPSYKCCRGFKATKTWTGDTEADTGGQTGSSAFVNKDGF